MTKPFHRRPVHARGIAASMLLIAAALAWAMPAETALRAAVAHSTEAPSLIETVPVGRKAVTPPPAVTVAV